MSKDISTIKYTRKVDLPGFLMSPNIINRNLVTIERYKHDPGAAYIQIRTRGGIVAFLRYAYEGKALEEMTKDYETVGFELRTASDNLKFVLGNYKHNEKTEKGTEALMNDLFAILATANYQMTPHDENGFMLLIRKRDYLYGREGNRFLPESDENYSADVDLDCYHIRESDEELIALISAITLWGNRVGVSFNTRYCKDRYEMKPAVARDLFGNAGVLNIFETAEKMQMIEDVQDCISYDLAFALLPKDEGIPNWMAVGGRSEKDDAF